MRIRSATPADAERLCEIYNYEIQTSTVTLDLVPRTLVEQRRYLAERSGGLAVLVAEEESGRVIGFGGLSFYRDRPGYRTSVEDSVYVDRACHGQGVGSALLSRLLEVGTSHGFHTVFARIVGPQPASVALHGRHGFDLVGIERQVGRKFGRWHDVAIMQCML